MQTLIVLGQKIKPTWESLVQFKDKVTLVGDLKQLAGIIVVTIKCG